MPETLKRSRRSIAVLIAGVSILGASACSDAEPSAAPETSGVVASTSTSAAVASEPSDGSSGASEVELEDEFLMGSESLPNPLDQDGALACANAESGLYRMRDGDSAVASERTVTAQALAAGSPDERFSSLASSLDVAVDDPAWEPAVRAFLEVCRRAGYQPL